MCDKILRMIDLKKAKKQFQIYLNDYDTKNSKNALKIKHTMGVVKMSEYISTELNLSKKDINIAMLIALLHDIGRFEQVTRFNSLEDYNSIDHAQFGFKILFKDGLITKFLDSREFDNIISKAILNHNKLKIEEGLNERELLHAKIIRDADKVDNLKSRVNGNIQDFFNSTLEELEKSQITDKIYEDFMNCKMIISTERKFPLDFWISYLAYIFDFNFLPGLKYVQDNDYVNKIIDRIDYKVPKTKSRMENIKNNAIQYISKKINNDK
jgi:putative nucleotidyltransferase with HDIG domain